MTIFKKYITKSLLALISLAVLLPGAARAANCPNISDVSLEPGDGFFNFYSLSQFATAFYYFDTTTSGNFAPIGLNVQGFPGAQKNTTSGIVKGFLGSSTNMGVSFFVAPGVAPGSQSTITIKVRAVLAREICRMSFTATVMGQSGTAQWTNWLDRDNESGSGDWELRGDFSNVCASPIDIQARVRGTTTVYNEGDSTPNILHVFNPSIGLACRNDDQSNGRCSDYEVRFLCL